MAKKPGGKRSRTPPWKNTLETASRVHLAAAVKKQTKRGTQYRLEEIKTSQPELSSSGRAVAPQYSLPAPLQDNPPLDENLGVIVQFGPQTTSRKHASGKVGQDICSHTVYTDYTETVASRLYGGLDALSCQIPRLPPRARGP